VAAKPEFARIIDREAAATLRPLGLAQKGRSRTWVDDRGWWLTIVEFQPSKHGNASFLNVGACWLTYAKDYLSFDLGYRQRELAVFETTEQFTEAMRDYAIDAADRVVELRRTISSPAAALERLMAERRPGTADWNTYHAGVFAGVVGDLALARRLLGEVLGETATNDWQKERASRAEALAKLDAGPFRDEVVRTVASARALLKLPPPPGDVF
jgi:hypothetical protein